MKIAVFHELHAGGARRAVNDFAKYLKVNNVVDLFTTDQIIKTEERNEYHKVYKYTFKPKKSQGKNWKARLYKDTIELYRLAQLHKQIAQKIDHSNYDIVFIHPSQYSQAPFILRYLKSKKIYYCQEPLRIVYDDLFQIDKKL